MDLVFPSLQGCVLSEDVFVCFSLEEWRLLGEAQRFLYGNMMLETLALLAPWVRPSHPPHLFFPFPQGPPCPFHTDFLLCLLEEMPGLSSVAVSSLLTEKPQSHTS